MAKVFGVAGRYVSQEAIKRTRAIWAYGLMGTALISAAAGFIICLLAQNRGRLSVPAGFAAIALFLSIWLFWNWSSRKLDVLEQQRMRMRRGAAGETSVALTLADLPEEFHIINDLTTPFGNLDHVVVGPTGVFILDTKAWRGVVTADDQGELLCDGRPTQKPLVRQFLDRTLTVKEKISVLRPGIDLYYHALFVFTSARVNAHWRSTGRVHCIRDDQLSDYIVERKSLQRLTNQQVEEIASAFSALARMDADFTEAADSNEDSRRPAQAA